MKPVHNTKHNSATYHSHTIMQPDNPDFTVSRTDSIYFCFIGQINSRVEHFEIFSKHQDPRENEGRNVQASTNV